MLAQYILDNPRIKKDNIIRIDCGDGIYVGQEAGLFTTRPPNQLAG